MLLHQLLQLGAGGAALPDGQGPDHLRLMPLMAGRAIVQNDAAADGGHEALADELSEDLHVEFVLETVDLLVEEHGSTLDNTTIVHSDQGCHYTSRAFIEKLKDNEFVQSMSRKGNCWDNAPQESFFGHMKDEISEKIAACETFAEVKAVVEDWLDYYNKDRYQWDLLKLSPKEYYEYLVTGIYPLPTYTKD